MSPEAVAAILDEVLAVIDTPSFAPVFAAGSRAEVEIAGRVTVAGAPAIVSGRVDRLAVTPGRVLIVDYKTNRPAPAGWRKRPPPMSPSSPSTGTCCRSSIRAAPVAAAILWTDSASLMEVPAESMDSAMVGIAGRLSPPCSRGDSARRSGNKRASLTIPRQVPTFRANLPP